MLISLFEREPSSSVETLVDSRWRLPKTAVVHQSAHCVIASTRRPAPGHRALAPHAGERGVTAVCDGRLDNRDELMALCGFAKTPDVTDDAIVSALYARFGADCANRLAGEFRFVVYDAGAATLLAAVDFACTRRLWWRECGSLLVVASSIGELYGLDEQPSLEEDYLIERLVSGWNSNRRGPFVGSSRFFPAEALCASTRTVAVRKYWCPSLFASAYSPTSRPEDFVDEFAHLLQDGVQRRLPPDRPLLCELSGGLDSTTITTLASRLLGGTHADRLHAFTVSYPGAPRTDERTRAAAVAEAAGVTHHVVERQPSDPVFDGMPENAFYWDEPRFNVHSHATALAKHALLQEIGADVVFSGAGAEAVLCEDMAWPVFLADSLRRGEWDDLYRGLRCWQNTHKGPLLILLARSCLAPLVRPAAAVTLESRRVPPLWVTRRAKRRYAQLRRQQPRPVVDRRNIGGSWMAEQWGAVASAADQGYGVSVYETRFPFLHKPMVERLLAMPWSVKVAPATNKLLLRRLAVDLLPSRFATRASRGADQAIGHALAAQHERVRGFVSDMALHRLGIIDEDGFRGAVSRAQNGFARGLRFIVTTLGVELWTRSVLAGDWRRMQREKLWPREAAQMRGGELQ
jgi:asparagine synthase (glutamine-hydrolysing)